MKKTVLALFFLSFIWGAFAQTSIKKKYYSGFVKDSVDVTIWLPDKYVPLEKHPVFYDLVYDHSNYLSAVLQNYFEAPKSIVIHPEYDPGNGHYSNPELTEAGRKYYQFLTKELIPTIEKEYNTTQYRVAVGLSQGADYVNYILRNNPELFKAWLIFAIEKPGYEPTFSDYTKNIKQPVDYFIAVANDEPYRVEFANKMDSNLSLNKLINVRKQYYSNSSHSHSILYGFPDALQFIFDSYINLRAINKGESITAYSKNMQDETISKYGVKPEFNNFLYHIMNELNNTKDTNEINQVLKDILPECSEIQLFNIAYPLINNGVFGKAEELLLKAAAFMPLRKKDVQLNPVMIYRTLALNVYDKQNKYEKAFQTLLAGHNKIKDYDIGLLYYIGSYSLKRNFHIQEGINALEEILPKRDYSNMSLFFSDDEIYAELADGYLRIKNKKKAMACAKKALEINPDNEQAKELIKKR